MKNDRDKFNCEKTNRDAGPVKKTGFLDKEWRYCKKTSKHASMLTKGPCEGEKLYKCDSTNMYYPNYLDCDGMTDD